MPRLGFIIDLEKCYGCDACSTACRNEHLWPDDVPFCVVVKEPRETPGRMTVPLLCMQCDHPGCLARCEDDALEIDRDGVVVVDLNRCTGCGACVAGCPFGVMAQTDTTDDGRLRSMMTPKQRASSARWDLRRRKNVPAKCELCPTRRAEGRPPACVAVCPTGALIFGDLDDPDSDISRQLEEGATVSIGPAIAAARVFYRLPRNTDGQRIERLVSNKRK